MTVNQEQAGKSEQISSLKRILRRPDRRGLRLVLLILLMALCWYAYQTLFPPLPEVDLVSLGAIKTELQVVDQPPGAYLVLPDGTLWIWGQPGGIYWNPYNPTQFPRHHPEKLADDSGWRTISAFGRHNAGIKLDGSVWEWGSDAVSYSQGDIGGPEGAWDVSDPSGWRSVMPGDNMITGVQEDGTLWYWKQGLNSPRRKPPPNTVLLRDKSTGLYSYPEITPKRHIGPGQMGTNNDWLQIVSYGPLNLGLRKQGTIWAWGSLSNSNRPRGSLLPEDFPTPIQICAETNWIELTAGVVPLARNRKGELWQPLTQSPDPGAAGWVVGQLLATNVLANGFSLVKLIRTELYLIRADGSLWHTSRTLRPLGGSARVQATTNWQRVGKRQDWVWLSSGGSTGFGLTADHILWFFGLDYGRVGNPDILARWRLFHERLIHLATPNIAPNRGGGLQMSEIPTYWEPRPLLRMTGTNGLALPPLPAISSRQGSEGGKAE